MENEEKIVLTLNSEEEKPEEETSTEEVKPEIKKVVHEDNLSESELKMVDDFVNKIDINDTATILQYGSAAQNKVADFSDSALNKVKAKDIDDIGDTLLDLVGELKNFDASQEKDDGFLSKLFKKSSNKVTSMKDKFDSADSNVDKIVKILETHQITLLKDVNLLDQLYDKNLQNYKELTMYILAGNKKLEQVKNVDLPQAQAKAAASGLSSDAQEVADLSSAIERFEKKLHDLELTRTVSLQMGPQIRLVQNNDTIMIEKIQSTIANTIPLWKSQMLIALGLSHSNQAIKAQNEVSEFTNKMLKENAANLKSATIETAKESQRGIVDIETLTKTNQDLIDTLTEVKKIQQEGAQKRADAQKELVRIESELQAKLTDIMDSKKDQ